MCFKKSYVINRYFSTMKSILTLFALAAALQLTAQVFTQKADFPQPLERSFSFALDGKIYAGTGRDETGKMNNHIWQFDPATNIWTQKGDFPTIPFRNGIAMVIDGAAYAGMGWDGGVNNLFVWYKYDAATDTWTAKKPITANVGTASGIFSLNGKGYTVCGSGQVTAEQNEVWEYDPATDVWTQKNNFPGAARDFTFAVAAGGFGFAGLGDFFLSPPFFSDMYKYDPAADSWTAIAPIPVSATGVVAEGGCSFSAVVGGKIVLMSLFGLNSADIADFLTVYVYDIATDQWTLYPNANVAGPRITPITGQSGSKAWFGAGLTFNGVAADFYEIDMAALVVGLEEANPGFSGIKITAADGFLTTEVPAEVLQKFAGTGLSLDLYSMNGRLLRAFPLSEKAGFDISGQPVGPLVWAVRAGNRTLKSGKIVR